MAGVSVSHMVIFIASIGVAVGVAGALVTTVNDVSSAVTSQGQGLSETVRTDISVISDPGRGIVYEDGNVTLLVKNTGSGDLRASEENINVVVDGKYAGNITVNVVSTSLDVWAEGEVIRLTAEGTSLDSGDHRAVVTVNGNKEVFKFRT
ncbi:flagellar protein G [Haladaptatus sp. F3-133]|uniref:Flagellar protein G n=1 Tax=Halorutilus salinus TaxID=2487751 RepID=A0A9Q4C3R2_9EURY|nr:flagellar protein G [Halorutilus salinus]MCX2818425.1 flagellar protein G [Halorutilus salinus]